MSHREMMDDRLLVTKVLNGEMQAFQLLVRQNERLVAHMIGRLVKSVEDREELCQDVFIRVFDKLGEFNFNAKLSTWIATIAYRHAINHLKKKRLLTSDLDDEANAKNFVENTNPESLLEEQDEESYVLKLVDELPANYKVVLLLFHVEAMSYQEIEAVTGMPEGTVKSYLFRARNLLKDKLKEHLKEEEVK